MVKKKNLLIPFFLKLLIIQNQNSLGLHPQSRKRILKKLNLEILRQVNLLQNQKKLLVRFLLRLKLLEK